MKSEIIKAIAKNKKAIEPKKKGWWKFRGGYKRTKRKQSKRISKKTKRRLR